jgi:DNA replication protein DnaC
MKLEMKYINNIIKGLFDDITNNRIFNELFSQKEKSLLATCKINVINRSSSNETIDKIYIEIISKNNYTFEYLQNSNAIINFINIIKSEFENKITFQHSLKYQPLNTIGKKIYYDSRSFKLSSTFDNFIVDESNKRAYELSKEISNTNFRNTNLHGTIGIYGDRGLGKTHLQEAIINNLMEKEHSFHIYYFKKNLWNNFLKKIASQKNYEEAIEDLANADLIIFDDLSLFFNTNSMFFLTALYDLIDLRMSKKKITLYSIQENPEDLSFTFNKSKIELKDFNSIFNYKELNNGQIKATIKKEFESRLCNRTIKIDYPSNEAKLKFIKFLFLETGYIDVANLSKREQELLIAVSQVLPNDFRKAQGIVYECISEIIDTNMEMALINCYKNLTGINLSINTNKDSMFILKNKINKILKKFNLTENDILGKNKRNSYNIFIKKAIIYSLIVENKYSHKQISSFFNVTKAYISKIKKNFVNEYQTKYLKEDNEFEIIYKEITKIIKE